MNPLDWLIEVERAFAPPASVSPLTSERPGHGIGVRRKSVLERARDLRPPSLPEILELLGSVGTPCLSGAGSPHEGGSDTQGADSGTLGADSRASGAGSRAHEAGVDLLDAALTVRRRIFGSTVRLFAPLYYSNVCANDCVYCGFRRSLGSSKRRVLDPVEVGDEAAALVRQGHRQILLIGSEDPSPRGQDLVRSAVRAIRERVEVESGGIRLSLEIAPRPVEDFAELAAHGVSGYVLFQETYDPDTYRIVHPAGPKADFANRLDGPARAADGGIARLGLGVLFGLSDPVRDAVALIAHARFLHQRTGRPVASVSVPRLEPAEGVPFTERPPHPVEDALWLRIIAVLRLALPWTDIIVSTREAIALRRESLAAGATVFSAGSRTDPGGYSDPGESRAQFLIGDDRSLGEVAEDLEALGYEPTVR